MMRAFLATAAFVALAGAAQAADSYASLYGNTLTTTRPDGSKTVSFINQDMSFELHFANGSVVRGTYAWKNATTICYTQTDPVPPDADEATQCYADQRPHNVGDSWTMQAPDGKTYAFALTAGR